MRMRLTAGMTIVGLLAVGGCGDEPTEQVTTEREPLEAVLAATAQTTGADSFRLSTLYELGESGSACADEMMPSSMDFEAAIDGSGQARVMEVTDRATGEVGIVTADALYVPASVLSGVEVDTPWVAIGVDDYDAYTLLGPSALGMFAPYSDDAEAGMGSLDSMFDEIKETAGTVTEVGTEEIRGQAATHYRVEIDPEKVRTQLAEEYGLDPTSDEMDDVPMSDHIDVWIGEDDYVRRVETFPADPETDPLGFANVHVVAEAWDHGADLTVAAPPAEDVTRARDLGIEPTEPETLSPECEAELMEDAGDPAEGVDAGGPEGWAGPAAPDQRACFEAAGIELIDELPGALDMSDEAGFEGPWFEMVPSDDPRWEAYLACLPPAQAAVERCEAETGPPVSFDPGSDQASTIPAPLDDMIGEDDATCFELALPDECRPDPSDVPATVPLECISAFGGSDG